MPIKYTLTKNDMLAEQIHNHVLRAGNPNALRGQNGCEDGIKVKATILASFASSLSWQTSKMINSDGAWMANSPEVKNEYELARASRWKQVRSADIQEVSSMNISDRAFYAWLFFNVKKEDRENYKMAWLALKQEFAQECDDVSVERE